MTNAVLIQGLIVGVCAANLSAVTVSNDVGIPFHDLFIDVASVPGATVTERTAPANGAQTQFDWQNTKDSGIQVSLTSLNGVGHSWGGIVWGAELVGGVYDITPGSFTVGGSLYKNGNGSSLNYRTVGGNVLLGYEYGIHREIGMSAFIEILPYIGGGFGLADNELSNGSGNLITERGIGRYMDYGCKVGGFLTERNWVYGVLVGVERSSGKVTMDFPGASSELTLKRSGATFGLLAGYRF